jgi:hypothetical protein
VDLLIWPVARCDLSEFLQHLDTTLLIERRLHPIDSVYTPLESEELEAIAVLSDIIPSSPFDSTGQYLPMKLQLAVLRRMSIFRLWMTFGCLAKAIAHLHNDPGLRHRDLNAK